MLSHKITSVTSKGMGRGPWNIAVGPIDGWYDGNSATGPLPSQYATSSFQTVPSSQLLELRMTSVLRLVVMLETK